MNVKRRQITYAEQKPKHGKPIVTGDLCVGGNRDDADRSKVCGLVGYRISECAGLVITPFLTDVKSRVHAAASMCFGGKPPLALLGRS